MKRLQAASPTVGLALTLALTLAATPGALAQTAAADSVTAGSLKVDRAEAGPQMTDEERIAELNEKLVRNPADHRSWNDLGVIYARLERFDIARDSFLKAVQANPRNGDYHRNLGLAFSRLGEHDLAIIEFEAYSRLDQIGSQDFWRLIGAAQMRAGRLDDARATYRDGLDRMGPDLQAEGLRLVVALSAVEDETGDGEALRALLEEYMPAAQAYLAMAGDDADGADEARTIIHNRVSLMVEDGKLLESSGLLMEAAAQYEAAHALAPDRDDLLPRLVDVYLDADESMKARVAARLAREEHPEEAGTWIATAKVYEQTDRLEDAVTAYNKAFEINPDFPGLRLAIGNLLMRLGRDQEASEFLREGVATDGTEPEVVYNYAVSQIREKNYHAAIASLRKVVQQRPDMAEAWIALAQSLRVTKQYGSAVEPYAKALELAPDAKLAYNLGICARKSGRTNRAIAAYEQALELDPEMIEARYNLSLAYMDAKRYEDAVASFEIMAEQEPDSYRVYYSKGLAYYYLGRWDDALEAYDMASSEKDTPALLNNIGLVYDKLGNKKEAKRWYDLAKEKKSGG